MSDHVQRLEAALAAYPQGFSGDDAGNTLVRVRAEDLRGLLGDLHAYHKTWEIVSNADAAEPYEASDAEVREGEQLDSVSYVIRRGETGETAFRRAARAEIVRLRRHLSTIQRAETGR